MESSTSQDRSPNSHPGTSPQGPRLFCRMMHLQFKIMEETAWWVPRNPDAGLQFFITSMKGHQYLCCWIHRGQMRCYAGFFLVEFHEPVAIPRVLMDMTISFFLLRFDVQSTVEGHLTRSVFILLPVSQTFQKLTRPSLQESCNALHHPSGSLPGEPACSGARQSSGKCLEFHLFFIIKLKKKK